MKTILYAASLLLITTFLTFAQEPAFMALVRKNYSGKTALTAQFDLTTYWSVREREEKKSGELLLDSGEKFRASIGKEVFVSDGKDYYQYSERTSQLVIRKLSDIDLSFHPSRILSSFLSGRAFTEKGRSGGTVELAWSGKASDAGGYTSIVAFVEEKSGVIKTLRLTDEDENINTYVFKKTVFDKPPSKDVFKFSAPKGVEVIDLRENNVSN
ncbi:MAG: outer membrane lipoprotein carrier protein LolA [Chitinispirillales bacterium]|jgi:outer membrane lipoprotein-sorting protein|nr:outer membrane lipoprotein carrier protein LolA [Chitinispirillales bacterium]